MKQITIYDLLPLLKKGYVAMDEDAGWFWYDRLPDILDNEWWNVGKKVSNLDCFNIAPFDGDWKDSLIKVEHKCTSKCTSSAQVKEHIIHIEDFAPPHPTGFMSESKLKRMFEHKEEE